MRYAHKVLNRWSIPCLWILVFAAVAPLTQASTRTFLAVGYNCAIAGGQVWITKEKDDYILEILGSPRGRNVEYCGKGVFGFRMCKDQTIYNFKIVCRDGVADLPDFFMALFGNDQVTIDNGFRVSNNVLSYIDPGPDFQPEARRRVAFPKGFAPLTTTPIDSLVRTIDWDDANGRISISRPLSTNQEERIRQMFTMKSGNVEPFPLSRINQAMAIANEAPAMEATAAPPQGANTAETNSGGPSRPASSDRNKLVPYAIAGAILIFGIAVARRVPAGGVFGRVAVGVIVAIISSVVLNMLGLKDELTLYTVSILGGIIVFTVSLLG